MEKENALPMAKVSVIVPIYGVEKFIERCARSLFEQTLDSIEYIFVDDCTKDKSIEVLQRVIDDYPQRKPFVKILHHQVNQGLPTARHTGLLQATGEYIAHCDSDDWVEKDIYQTLYNKAKQEDADICYCDFCLDDGKDYHKHQVKFSADYDLNKEHIMRDLLTHKITGNVCGYISHRRLYQNKILYPKGNMGEDWALTVQLMYYVSKPICYVSRPMYHYFINPDSICRVPSIEKKIKNLNDLVINTNTILDFFKMNDAQKDYEQYYMMMKLYCRYQMGNSVHNKQCYQAWRNCFKEVEGKVMGNKEVTTQYKIYYLLGWIRIFPLLFYIKQQLKRHEKVQMAR